MAAEFAPLAPAPRHPVSRADASPPWGVAFPRRVTQVEAFANFSDSDSEGEGVRFSRARVPEPAAAGVEGKQEDVCTFDVDVGTDEESEDDIFGASNDDVEPFDEADDARAGAAAADGTPARPSRPPARTEYSPVHATSAPFDFDESAIRPRDRGEGKEAAVLGGAKDDFELHGAASDRPREHRAPAHRAVSSGYSASADVPGRAEAKLGEGRAPAAAPAAGGRATGAGAFDPVSESLMRVPAGVVQCAIVRNRRGMNRLYPQYQLYWQDGDSEVLLMCAQKQRSNKTSNYHIFDMTVGSVGGRLNKKHRNYMGKLRTSFRKHDCVVYGVGENPKALAEGSASEADKMRAVRPELGAVFFRKVSVVSHLTEGPVPRKMHVAVPRVDSETGRPEEYRVLTEERTLLARAAQDDLEPFIQLHTKDPTFQNGTYRLNFHQRVTEASVKNFQLVMSRTAVGVTERARAEYEPQYAHWKGHYGKSRKGITRSEDIVLQFGKVSEDRFHLDLRAPVSPFQAFAVCLCQFNL